MKYTTDFPRRRCFPGLAALVTVALAAAVGSVLKPVAAAAPAVSTPRPSRHALPMTALEALENLEQAAGGPVRVVLRPVGRLGAPGQRAARVNWVSGFRIAAAGSTPARKALSFLRAHGRVIGIEDPDVELSVRRVTRWRAGHVVRFDVRVSGLPVFGRSVKVRTTGGFVTAVSGSVPELVGVDSPSPSLTEPQVRNAVLAATGRYPTRVLGLGYWIARGDAHLVWRADQYVSNPEQRLVLLVSAHTGEPLMVGRGFVHAQGYAYLPSPHYGPREAVDLEDLTSANSLEGTYARAFQCNGSINDWPPCGNAAHSASPTDATGNYFIEPVEPSISDLFAEVQGYYHATAFSKWYQTRFGFVWSCGGHTYVDVLVNLDYENAFYGDSNGDPQECGDVTFGEGVVDFVYDAEVLYHEFTHGVVEKTAALGCQSVGICLDDLGVNLIPNGLNEGFADYFSMTYVGDPTLGEHVAEAYGDPDLRTGLNDHVCPWDIISESHHDGHVFMGGGWTLRQAMGADKADDLIYGTLLAMPEDGEYAEAAQVLLSTAADLQAQGHLTAQDVQAVQNMVGSNDRNMVDCYRVIPLDNRPPGKTEVFGYGMETYAGYLDELPVGLQWTVWVPEDGIRLKLDIEAHYGFGTMWKAYLRKDEPLYIDVQWGEPWVVADHTFENNPDSIVLTHTSTPQLEPGTLYHLAIVYSAEWGELFQIWADVRTGTIEPDASVVDAFVHPDAAPRPDGSAHGDGGSFLPPVSPRPGCNCATAARPGPRRAPLVLVLAALLSLVAVGRRRRP